MSHWKKLRMSRLTFFQLVLLVVALAFLWHVGVSPWQKARALERSRAQAAELVAEFEGEVASLDPADYEPEPVAAEVNVGHWAMAGGATLLDTGRLNAELEQLYRHPDTYELDLAETRQIVERNSLALPLLHRMADLERSDFGLDYAAGSSLRLPELGQLRAAGALLVFDALIAAEDGRTEDGLRSLRSLAALIDALSAEAPRPLYAEAGRLDSVMAKAIRWTLEHSSRPDLGALAEIAAPAAEASTLCERFRRMVLFDASVRIARGPDARLLKAVRTQWLPPSQRDEVDVRWVEWAHHAFRGLRATLERCSDDNTLRPTPSSQNVILGSSMSDLSAEPGILAARAVRTLDPEIHHWFEFARRARHQRLMATVALTLMDAAAERGVEPEEVTDLALLFADETTKKLARCAEIRDLDGIATLLPIRNRTECPFWTDESLNWPLEAR